MNYLRRIAAIAVAALSFISFDASAVIDANAPVVKLRYDNPSIPDDGCTEGGVAINNCFTGIGALNTWIRDTRMPTTAKPLLVEIGPGSYAGKFNCTDLSGITLRGSGRDNTVFKGGMYLENCDMLSVSSLQINGSYYIIEWSGTGRSTWTDVEVIGSGIGWYDDSPTCTRPGTAHYWYASRFEVHPYLTQAATYVANCGEHWFQGSELTATHAALPGVPYPSAGTGNVIRASNSEVHVYGSVIRMLAPSVYQGTITSTVAVWAMDSGAEIHIHGTGIDVLSDVAIPVTVLQSTGGMIHADVSAYNLKSAAGGSVTRIYNQGGHVHAPYQWQHIPDPAVIPSYASTNGADTTNVTAGTSDGHPHVSVYSSTCPSNARWYDQVDKVCRSQ